MVNAAGAWGDEVARRAGVRGLGLIPKRRTVVQLRVARNGLRHVPFCHTDLHASFYFKGEGDHSVWVCPLDRDPERSVRRLSEEIDVARAIARFEEAVDWPVEAVEHKWGACALLPPTAA